jgi:hypothetical protein
VRRWLFVVSCAAAACAPSVASSPPPAGLHTAKLHARSDPTVRGARLVPEALDLSLATVEASGTLRGIVQGDRFRVDARGGVRTAEERIEDGSLVVAVPARLGGGFLFVVGDTLYRADEWLAQPRPFFRSSHGVKEAFAGLDRIYVRTKLGAHLALDPRTGAMLDLGPWPADPFVGPMVALDGWRALALTDVRGVVGTSDAGRSWVTLDVPIRAQAITPVRRNGESGAWTEVTPDAPAEAFVVSDAAPPSATPRAAPPAQTPPPAAHCYLVSEGLTVSPMPSCADVMTLGPRHATSHVEGGALRAALEGGWPLEDRTAIVATSRDVVRVSLEDGSIVESVPNGFDQDLGDCHALSLGGPSTPSAFGFVCGAVRGGTTLFAYDVAAGRLRALRKFATPRLVEATGNGALLVHGPCDERDVPASTAYCVGSPPPRVAPNEGPPTYDWREVHTGGAPGAIATVTSDGTFVQIVASGALEDAHLTLIPRTGETRDVPLQLSERSPVTRRIVSRGILENGLQERRPGVLGGWIRVEGTAVGVEIAADGSMRLGAYVKDLDPFVAGRYGLGWTRTHLGLETTDGGMTWSQFTAPTALGPPTVRACGPAGCVADGWLRVGWGERLKDPAPPLVSNPPPRTGGPWFRLSCRAMEPLPPHDARTPASVRLDLSVLMGVTGTLVLPGSRLTLAAPRPDTSFEPPVIGRGDRLLHADVFHAFEGTRVGLVGRVYTWGPSSGDWSGVAKWVTRWRVPFGGRTDVRSTMTAVAPFADLESARAELGLGPGGTRSFTTTISEDGAHALLAVKSTSGQVDLATLDEAGTRAPVARADGGSWGPIDAAIRVGPDWFIALPSDARRVAIDVLRVSGGVARRVATVPRFLAPTTTPVRLARSDRGNTVGLVVEGEPAAARSGASRWVVPIELDNGLVDAPEPLGAVDLSDRRELAICDERGPAGWTLDTTWSYPNIAIDLGDVNAAAYLHGAYARLRLSPDRACVERLVGTANEDALDQAGRRLDHRGAARRIGEPMLPVTLLTSGRGPDESTLLECQRTSDHASEQGTK